MVLLGVTMVRAFYSIREYRDAKLNCEAAEKMLEETLKAINALKDLQAERLSSARDPSPEILEIIRKANEPTKFDETGYPLCNGCGEPVHPNYPCEEAKTLRGG